MADSPGVKVLLVLIDGLGDVSLPPSASSHASAREQHGSGLTGLMDPVEPGLACGSDTAHLSLLGYPPLQYYRGRGAFESMGAGLPMQEGDIAFKSNFAWMSPDGVVVRRRADRAFHEWGVPLCDFLSSLPPLPSFPSVSVSVRYATEHRCGVRLRGPDLSDCVSGTDPLHDGHPLLPCRPTLPTLSALRTSALVDALSQHFHAALSSHPLVLARLASHPPLPSTNVVLLRGAGARIPVPPWPTRHAGRAFAIAPTAIIAGLAESLGMDVVKVDGATGDYRTDVRAKGAEAVRRLRGQGGEGEGYSFGFVHVKAVDDAGHDRSWGRKVEWLERVDGMVGEVVAGLRAAAREGTGGVRYVVLVTGDHSTPVRSGDHSCEPVPLVLAEVEGRGGLGEMAVRSFDEVECSRGVLGRFPGSELMGLVARFSASLMPAGGGADVADHR